MSEVVKVRRVYGQNALARRAKQPAFFLMKEQGHSIGDTAETLGVPFTHLRGALYGITYPSLAVRDLLPVFLGVPLSKLFDADILAGKYDPRKGPHYGPTK